MQRIALLLFGMVSLVAGGVIVDRGRIGLNAVGGLGLQTVQGIRGGVGSGSGSVLSKDDLLRQKFILDILNQVYTPLEQPDLLMLDDPSIITNENLYMRPLTQEMLMFLDLIAKKQILSKGTIVNIKNPEHIRQIVGFYRLLVAAGDFDTFKRLVVHTRQNLNTEIFVNCLVLALGERHDTQMLVVPALHEILPQRFLKESVIDQVRHLDTGDSSVRPQLMDVMGMGMGPRGMWLNSQLSDQQQGGLLGVLNRSQLWMPWRELHKQMAWRKMMGGNVVQQGQTQSDKLVIDIPSNGLLCQDVGLKSYVSTLIGKILVNQDTVRNLNKNYNGMGGQGYDSNDHILWDTRGQMGMRGIVGGIGKTHADTDMHFKYGNIFGGRHMDAPQQGINTDRMWHAGRRLRDNDFGVTDDWNTNGPMGIATNINRNSAVNGGMHWGNDMDENDWLTGKRFLKSGLAVDDEIDTDRNLYMGGQNTQHGQHGINTVSANDARLLFVGRRGKNPHSAVNMGTIRNVEDDDMIPGGRRAFNDHTNDEHQRIKHSIDIDDITWNDMRRLNSRHSKMMDLDNEDDLLWNMYRGTGLNGNNRESLVGQQINDNIYRNYRGQDVGRGMGIGAGRDQLLDVVARGQRGQQQYVDNNQDMRWNSGLSGPAWTGPAWTGQAWTGPAWTGQAWTGQAWTGESLDMHLPTTNINDERLLHINRHKLNNIDEGRRVSTAHSLAFEDVNDSYSTGNQRSYLDEQSSWKNSNYDTSRRGVQNSHLGERDIYGDSNRAERHGHRYRRSIVSQGLNENSALNGKLILHSLQHLVALLNLERIALGEPQLIDTSRNNIVHNIHDIDMQNHGNIENFINNLDYALQQKIGTISASNYNQKLNEIGLMLAGQIQDLGLIDIMGKILQQPNQPQSKGMLHNAIEKEAVQTLLASIVKVIDNNVQQGLSQHEEFSSTVQGLSINDVRVDKLQTYMERANIDLSN